MSTTAALLFLGVLGTIAFFAVRLFWKLIKWAWKEEVKLEKQRKVERRVKRIGELRAKIKADRKEKLKELRLENWAKKELDKTSN